MSKENPTLAELARELDAKESWIRQAIDMAESFKKIGFLQQAREAEYKIKQAHDDIRAMVFKYKQISTRGKA